MKILFDEDLELLRWHLVLCKPNQHNLAQRALSRLDCEVFLPRQTYQRRWRGRLFEELRPVFPGYLFLGLDSNRVLWHSIRAAQGVSRIIGFGEQGPALVPAQVVAGLMARCDQDGVLQPIQEKFSVGDKIRIVSGPFVDFVTSIERIDPDHRLHVLLEMLGRATRLVLDPRQAIRSC